MAKAKTTTTKDKTKRPAAAKAAAPATTTTRVTVAKNVSRQRLGKELVLGSLLAELFGVFVLTMAALNSAGNVIIASVTVMILVMALSRLSGGHINPAVTLGMLATRQISGIKAAGYVVAQLVGAMLALVVVTQFVHTAPAQVDPATGQSISTSTVFAVADLNGQWRPFLAEALGGLVFGVGAAAAVLGRKNSHESGFIIGGSLLLGLIAASLGSAAIVNPAVALGLSAYKMDNFWTVLVYAIAPVIGLIAGAWAYKLLQWDVTGTKTLKAEE